MCCGYSVVQYYHFKHRKSEEEIKIKAIFTFSGNLFYFFQINDYQLCYGKVFPALNQSVCSVIQTICLLLLIFNFIKHLCCPQVFTLFNRHPFLEELDRFQKWPTVESSLNVYRHIASHFKCLFKNISLAVFEKRHCQFLPQ